LLPSKCSSYFKLFLIKCSQVVQLGGILFISPSTCKIKELMKSSYKVKCRSHCYYSCAHFLRSHEHYIWELIGLMTKCSKFRHLLKLRRKLLFELEHFPIMPHKLPNVMLMGTQEVLVIILINYHISSCFIYSNTLIQLCMRHSVILFLLYGK